MLRALKRTRYCKRSLRACHAYEIKDKRRSDLVSDAPPFGRLSYSPVCDAIDYAKHYSRAHDAVISVYDAAGKLIEVHKHKGDFKEP
jgi:hypothetical protein